MRISDWSSDVCSSDLAPADARGLPPRTAKMCTPRAGRIASGAVVVACTDAPDPEILRFPRPSPAPARPAARVRSEEHTSELQSLMRISYDVFCLKKKKKKHK